MAGPTLVCLFFVDEGVKNEKCNNFLLFFAFEICHKKNVSYICDV